LSRGVTRPSGGFCFIGIAQAPGRYFAVEPVLRYFAAFRARKISRKPLRSFGAGRLL
jgi:hypothetical protein